MFKVPEKYRLKTGQLGSDESYGNNGVFTIQIDRFKQIRCIASDGEGWEHVSVSIMENRRRIFTPNWDEMCYVKALFWDDEDIIIQFHPPRSEYVNFHPNVLHLWRQSGIIYQTPKKSLIGP